MFHSAIVVIVVLLFVNTNASAESSEDHQGFTYFAPSTLNFQDIYSNSLALLAEDPSTASSLKPDESFHLSNMPTQFVEFHPRLTHIPPLTVPPATSPPPPKYILKASLMRNETAKKPEAETTTSTTTTTTTEEPDELIIKVLPIANRTKYQRGVLDLLFPAARVRSFKSVFDTVRRLLSHTF